MKYEINTSPDFFTTLILNLTIQCNLAVKSSLQIKKILLNKRAQRALGRSPEEKVKGHSGAIYRGPLMLSTKYW